MAERNIGRRDFVIGVAAIFTGGAVAGEGIRHLAEGVMTVQGRWERTRAELEAQGVTEPTSGVVTTAKDIIREDNQKPMAERNPELVGQATQHLTQKINFDIRYDDLFTRKSIEEGHSTEKHLQDIGLLGGGGALTAGGVWELKKAFRGADVARPLGTPVEAATRELFKKPQ